MEQFRNGNVAFERSLLADRYNLVTQILESFGIWVSQVDREDDARWNNRRRVRADIEHSDGEAYDVLTIPYRFVQRSNDADCRNESVASCASRGSACMVFFAVDLDPECALTLNTGDNSDCFSSVLKNRPLLDVSFDKPRRLLPERPLR